MVYAPILALATVAEPHFHGLLVRHLDPEQRQSPVLSFGCSSYGYDLRLSPQEFLIFKHVPGTVMNPKRFNPANLEPTELHHDEDGDYFFVDRKADFIRHKGRNISSFAVEAAFAAHPAVAESGAHGVSTAELESEAELKVAVVLKPGETASAEELARFVNDTAPYFFVPRYIEFLDELPHTPTGRVQKYKLRERGVTETTWDREAAGFVVRR